jgi:L-asparaginase
MSIRILVTGGTFDKEYNELDGTLSFKETHVPEMLGLGRSRVQATVTTLLMVDSLEMTDSDRRRILKACRELPENRIVVTHGTDTMEVTARILGQATIGKTVVLTGAMVPYKFGSSDGLFNLGTALGLVQMLPAGVYIAMNGRCFTWDNVHKDRRKGIFEEGGRKRPAGLSTAARSGPRPPTAG